MATYIFAFLIFSNPWATLKGYWQQYKTWLNYNTTGNYYNWTDFKTDKSPDKWKFGATLGIGFIPPGTKKYRIAEVSPAFDFNLSCKGIWFHTNLKAIFDEQAFHDWFTQYMTNFIFINLMTYIYSNNTIGQLLSYVNNLYPKYLDLDAKRCNDQEIMALVLDPRYKDLSWSQRLCVNAALTAGSSYPNAIENCKSNSSVHILFDPKSKLYSCFDKLQIDNDTREMLRALLGYTEYTQADTGIRVELKEPAITITEIFDSIYNLTAQNFDSAVKLLTDSVGLPEQQRYNKLYYYLAKISPPGGAITPEVVLDMISAPTTIRQTVKGLLSSTNAYIATKMLLYLAFKAINTCLSKNNVNISPSELNALKDRWDAAYKEFTLITKNFNPSKINEIVKWLKQQNYYYVATFISNNASLGFEPPNLPVSTLYRNDPAGPVPPVHDLDELLDIR